MVIETESSADRPYIVEEDNLIKALKKSSPISPLNVRIFKVPQVLRRHRPEAYEPCVISIGPIHRDREHVQGMENVKQWYLKTLLSRMDISLEKFVGGFNEFLSREPGKDIIKFGERARYFYEPLPLEDIEFMKIMILDGCFVIQLVRKIVDEKARDDGDPKWDMGSKFQYVCHDLLLLENQLPFFVLKSLYDFIREKLPDDGHIPKFSGALLSAFRQLKSLDQYLKPCRLAGCHNYNDDELCHILDLIRTSIVFGFKPNTEEPNENESGLDIPPATDLSKAGVKFKKNDSPADNLLDIKFEDGVLTIPKLTIGELTEPLFRNLIAFEQCYPDHSNEITSYAAFMDKLISSDEDIKLLSKKKILDNWLSVKDGSECFSNLYRDTTVKGLQYGEVSGKVNRHYQKKLNTYFEQFRRNYCSSPWKFIGFIAGIFLLACTLLQTIFTILSYKC